MSVIEMPSRTFRARIFTAHYETEEFKVAGTLDGFIDLAVPKGKTYQLSLDEARQLVVALNSAIEDVKANCLYNADALLEKSHVK